MIIYPYISCFPKFDGMDSILSLTHSLILGKLTSPCLSVSIVKWICWIYLITQTSSFFLAHMFGDIDSKLSSEIF